MTASFHIRTLLIALLVWSAFFVAGLPDYYRQYSFAAMVAFCLLLVPFIAVLAVRVIGSTSPGRRWSLALWLACYFTVPFGLLDFAYCGIYLGRGPSFLVQYWYLTVYYVLPWLLLATVAWRLSSSGTRGSCNRTSAST